MVVTFLDVCIIYFISFDCIMIFLTRQGNTSTIEVIFFIAYVVEWSRALDITVSMVLVQIPSREEQKIDRTNSNTVLV
jgi:hypothetical protein